MFLNKCLRENPALAAYGLQAVKEGDVLPDTYVLDLDAIIANGKEILKAGKEKGIRQYFMLKQLGRNPIVAKALQDIGFDGVVAVDFEEALLLGKSGIHLGNVGHLVQVPKKALPAILKLKPDVVTVYSREKIQEIEEAAKELDMNQKLLIRVRDDQSEEYPGQAGGFFVEELPELFARLDSSKHVSFGGFTIFPGLLYSEEKQEICPTENAHALKRAVKLADQHGYQDYMVNIPSCSCSASMDLIASLDGNCAEPGHALTGTTPLHADAVQPEIPGYVYVTQVSHNHDGKASLFGGGHYRRSHMKQAFVGENLETGKRMTVQEPEVHSIDYHFDLDGEAPVSAPAILCYRTQMFTTRSKVAVVSGIQSGKPELLGLYDGLGHPLERIWK